MGLNTEEYSLSEKNKKCDTSDWGVSVEFV